MKIFNMISSSLQNSGRYFQQSSTISWNCLFFSLTISDTLLSQRPQSQFPLWVEFPYYDLVRLDNRPPGPSPFLEEEEDGQREDEWEDEAQQFRRSLRNNEEDSRL